MEVVEVEVAVVMAMKVEDLVWVQEDQEEEVEELVMVQEDQEEEDLAAEAPGLVVVADQDLVQLEGVEEVAIHDRDQLRHHPNYLFHRQGE